MNASRLSVRLGVGLFLAAATPSPAAILGTNSAAEPLTEQRIAALPKAEQSAWKEYLKRSDRQRRADQEALQKEVRANGLKQIILPPEGRTRRWVPLDRPAAWYGEPEAKHIADVVLSFQTPAGGWSKNLN